MVRSVGILLVGGLLCAWAGQAQAQDGVLSQLYGNGVHAYFAGDYAKAHELLSSAISSGWRDPRCYYFRGLSYWKLGRPQEAAADFQQGRNMRAAI